MKKKQKNPWKTATITILILITSLFILFISIKNSTKKFYETQEKNQILTKQDSIPKNVSLEYNKIQQLKMIIQNYYKTHTYSKIDLFVCTDTSIDVWNLVKTKGINAQICVGNIEKNISNLDKQFNEINHAWVLAETKPFTWIALETTGGYLVWVNENEFYYDGRFCFDNPAEFKKFLELRQDFFDVCNEAEELIIFWNNNYLGKILTAEDYEFKGKLDAKREECNKIDNKLVGLLS